MARTHYEVLGVTRQATADEVRSAYRRLVLRFHPDTSADPKAKDIFIEIAAAYEVLSEPERRKQYDVMLEMRSSRPRAAQTTTKAEPKKAGGVNVSLATDLTRLSLLFSRGQISEAEKLAKSILQKDPKQAIAHAMLGDIARRRGAVDEAVERYAFALRVDPGNEAYQRRYDELLASSRTRHVGHTVVVEAHAPDRAPILMGLLVFCVLLLALLFIPFAPFMPHLEPISRWSMGTAIALMVGGAVGSAAMSGAGLLDRFTFSGPALALTSLALLTFWGAAAIYAFLLLIHRTTHTSLTRVMMWVVGCAFVVGVASGLRDASANDPLIYQVWLWGPNLAYVGAICGWMIGDELRKQS